MVGHKDYDFLNNLLRMHTLLDLGLNGGFYNSLINSSGMKQNGLMVKSNV